jgi:vacuolar-type H+-ATPase subunit H
MQEIVDEVIKTEEQATRIVGQAREKAAQIKNSVEMELNEGIKKAKEDAQNLLLEAMVVVRKEADAAYENAMKETEKTNRDFMTGNESKFENIIDKIIELTKSPDYDRD